MRYILIIFLANLLYTSSGGSNDCNSEKKEIIKIPAGTYKTLYIKDTSATYVNSFMIDKYAVTNKEFLNFLDKHPEWSVTEVKAIFADENYLKQMKGKQSNKPDSFSIANSPVTNVSWFAAKAYCKCQDKRLPTVDEWEYAAVLDDSTNGHLSRSYVLEWYSKPTPKIIPDIGSTFPNKYGTYDMHGLIWEWVLDFNTSFVTGESRGDSEINSNLYCAAGAVGAADLSDYAAFMRYGFRSSLQARYTIQNLGFRCVKEIN